LNYPSELRGKIVGNNRRVQVVFAAGVSLGVSAVLDGKVSVGPVFELFGRSAPSPGDLVVWLVPLIGLLGLAATLVFAGAPVREARGGPGQGPEPCPEPDREPRPEPAALGSLLDTLRAFAKVWWEDRDFRRYENFFFIFGFANIMTIPLTQIHAVDRLEADYWDLALINVAIVQGLMAVTLPFWGKLVDRHPPARLRGFINLILALDFLTLAVAPTIEWVYAGRVCRGIALGGGTLVWMLGSLYYARTPDKVPIYLGVHTVLTGLRWALAPFAGVWLKQLFRDDARPVFGLVFAVVAVTALLMIWQSRREEPRRPVEGPPMPAPRMTGA
ncbi:MAG: MFS transporter, partial [Planctomycetes bacterium]|nr:MFS transporter [Planctomycetota bacterium]